MNIEFDYAMTSAEVRAGIRFAYAKARVNTYCALGIGLLAVFLILLAKPEPTGTFFNLAVGFGIIIVAFPIWLFEYVIPVRIAEKVYRAHMEHGRSTMRLADDGLKVVSELGESKVKWEVFSKYIENDRLIILYLPNGESITLPKRMLRKEEVKELVGMLAQHLKGGR
jgi:hypothetical protein